MAVNDVEATYTTGNNTTAVVDSSTNAQTGPQNVSVTTPSVSYTHLTLPTIGCV